MHEEWIEKLSDYLDGELPPGERDAVDSHLRECAQCATVLEDLKRVIAKAGSVQPRPPSADLWAGIAARIDAPVATAGTTPFRSPDTWQQRWNASRRISFSLPQLAAAAALLMACSGGLVWSLAQRSARSEQAATTIEQTASTGPTDSRPDREVPSERRDVQAAS